MLDRLNGLLHYVLLANLLVDCAVLQALQK